MDRHEAQYAYDMKAQSAVEVCDEAGVELIHSATGYWRWTRGTDANSGNSFFETRDEAAIDFTQSQSFRAWLRSRGVYV